MNGSESEPLSQKCQEHYLFLPMPKVFNDKKEEYGHLKSGIINHWQSAKNIWNWIIKPKGKSVKNTFFKKFYQKKIVKSLICTTKIECK